MNIRRESTGIITIEKIALMSSLARKQIVFSQEVLKPEAVCKFLSAVGISKNIDSAVENARELIQLYEPAILNYKLESYVGYYTRAEVNLLYFNYLVKYCNIEPILALLENEDEVFWRVAFPHTDENQSKEYEDTLPPLNGKVEIIPSARAARRQRILDLLILKQKIIKNGFEQPHILEQMKFIDESSNNIFENYDIVGIMKTAIDQVMRENDAEAWIDAPEFDFIWLQNQFISLHDRLAKVSITK